MTIDGRTTEKEDTGRAKLIMLYTKYILYFIEIVRCIIIIKSNSMDEEPPEKEKKLTGSSINIT